MLIKLLPNKVATEICCVLIVTETSSRTRCTVYAHYAVCIVVCCAAPQCTNACTAKSQVFPRAHIAYCVFMCSESCKLMAEIKCPPLNKDDIEENPHGAVVVPHDLTYNRNTTTPLTQGVESTVPGHFAF